MCYCVIAELLGIMKLFLASVKHKSLKTLQTMKKNITIFFDNTKQQILVEEAKSIWYLERLSLNYFTPFHLCLFFLEMAMDLCTQLLFWHTILRSAEPKMAGIPRTKWISLKQKNWKGTKVGLVCMIHLIVLSVWKIFHLIIPQISSANAFWVT